MKRENQNRPARPTRNRSSRARRRGAGNSPSDGSTSFPVVGIGASAGGLEAFKRFFGAMPADSGMAFVLIQHLDPTHQSLTADLVGACTPMPVAEAEDGMRVEANRIYVIPPNRHLTIHEDKLQLTAPAERRGMRTPIDFFLRSLAENQREKAVGIILSGTGSDGTLGLKEIKATGGLTLAQDPRTAQHSGMPQSAIASGSVDSVLSAEQMPDVLCRYVWHASAIEARSEPGAKAPGALSSIIAHLRDRTKLDFNAYKKGTLRRRILRRMSLKQIDRMAAYDELLRTDPAEVTALFKDLLLSVTSFFREPEAWQVLQEQVIRRLVAEKTADAVLRAWVVGCATGEEAYSLAMLILEEMQAAKKNFPLQVFASDIDTEALEVARAGVYRDSIAAAVPAERLDRFFTKEDHSFHVNQEVRDTVVFAQQNLISAPPFSKLDLISCRNLLIYLEPAVQEKVIALLHFALVQDGYLFLGRAESVGGRDDLFEMVSQKWRIYRRVGSTRQDQIHFPVVFAPGPPLASPRPEAQPNVRLSSLVQHLLLQRYVPACVIINRASEILYFQGRTDDYLVRPTGPPTQDLVAQARNGLAGKLRGAVRQAILESRLVVVSGVGVRRGAGWQNVKVTVEPLGGARDIAGLLLVSFEDEPEITAAEQTASGAGAEPVVGDSALVRALEYELKTTKEELQQSVEEFRASNEELMSVNEELQSSNEELETSKEELEAANNDLDNLLTSTNIATVFLDTQFCIRRFTPAATNVFRLIPSDVGRDIRDIAPRFTDPSLLSDAAAVLAQPVAPKREVQVQDGKWYVRQVLPYRRRDGRIDGVVMTFSDVAAEALQEARLFAESIVDTVREPLLVLDKDLRVQSANRSFYQHFRVSPTKTAGQLLYELGNRQWDIPELRANLRDIFREKQPVLNDFEVEHEFKSLGRRIMLLNARVLVRGGDRPPLILLAIEDITERKHIQNELRESDARQRVEEQVRQRQAELAHMLRVSTVGELASGLAHELNQPLSAIVNDVEACARHVRSGKAKPAKLLGLLDEAAGEAIRAADIVEHLRGFIQKGEPRLERTDLCDIAHNVIHLLGRELESHRIKLQLDLVQTLPIYADRIQIEQVIVNLMQNAIEAVREAGGKRREIHLGMRTVKRMAEVAVRDTGAGFSADAAARVFEPFFTTKLQGLGMGLAISRSIVEAHQGRIWIEPPTDGGPGTTVCFSLPRRTARHTRKRRSK